MISRTLILLADGPGSDRIHDWHNMDVSRVGNSKTVPIKVGKTVWSSCVEAALEYVRLILDLHCGSARSNIMLATSDQASEPVLAFDWSGDSLSMAAYTVSLYKAIESARSACTNTPVAAEVAAADAARRLVKDLTCDEVVADEGRGGCRAVVVSNPEAFGASLATIADTQKAMTRAFYSEMQALGFDIDGTGRGSDILLEFVWVVGKGESGLAAAELGKQGGGGGTLGGGGFVDAANIKGQMCTLAALHHGLQSVRIIGIPMKDSAEDKSEGKNKKEYNVELLCRAQVTP